MGDGTVTTPCRGWLHRNNDWDNHTPLLLLMLLLLLLPVVAECSSVVAAIVSDDEGGAYKSTTAHSRPLARKRLDQFEFVSASDGSCKSKTIAGCICEEG